MATGSALTGAQIPPPRPPGRAESVDARDPGPRSLGLRAPPRSGSRSRYGSSATRRRFSRSWWIRHGFEHRYNSVKRFVAGLKRSAPEQFDRLQFGPGEEAQVDYGEGRSPAVLRQAITGGPGFS